MGNQGKIACLPANVREEVSRKLHDGKKGPEILAWLNSLAVTEESLKDRFPAWKVTFRNLSQWKCGGHVTWLEYRKRFEEGLEVLRVSGQLLEAVGSTQIEAASRFAAAVLAEAMEAAWKNRDVETIERLGQTVVSIRKCDIASDTLRQRDEEIKLLRRRVELAERAAEKEGVTTQDRTPSTPEERQRRYKEVLGVGTS